MTDLSPIPALGGSAPRGARHGAWSLTENAGLALASLALRRGAVAPLPFGIALPGPGLWAAGQGVAAFWTGPGQWFVEAEGRAEEDFARDLAQHAPGCSVTEQTDGWACFEIEGPEIEALMARLVNIDVAGFGPGSATRTALEHMSVFVIRRAADRLAVLGMRSSAGSLWHALDTAMARMEEPA